MKIQILVLLLTLINSVIASYGYLLPWPPNREVGTVGSAWPSPTSVINLSLLLNLLLRCYTTRHHCDHRCDVIVFCSAMSNA